MNMRLTLVSSEILNRSMNISVRASASRQEVIAMSRHDLIISMKIGCKFPSWVEKKVNELETFHTGNIHKCTGCAELDRFHGILLSAYSLIVSPSPFSWASLRMYFTTSIKEIGSLVRRLLTWRSTSPFSIQVKPETEQLVRWKRITFFSLVQIRSFPTLPAATNACEKD